MKTLLRPLLCSLALSALQPFSPSVLSQTPQASATVTGRVYNVATGFYLKNAEVRLEGTDNVVFTEDGGVYTITVPAGKVTLTASYTSVQTATVTIDIAAGATSTANFDLQPFATTPATAAIAGGLGEIVMLDRFTVTEERAGQAKAIMTQRAADNAVTAIATDNFGELTQGAIGEFLKYMPGVTIDYGEDEAESVRVGGLDPKYVGFSLDGIALSSSSETGSRANFFDQMSVIGIESIEFHQTLLARMPANTPAGKFELKSKYAFDRKRPQLRYTIGLDGVSDAIELGRSYMPDNKKHYRTYPGGQISYGGPFFNRRLGVDASISRFASYRNNQWQQTMYNYASPEHPGNAGFTFVTKNGNLERAEDPDIYQLQWRDAPQIRTTCAANLSIDYRITENLTFSLRNQFTCIEREQFNIGINLNGFERSSGNDHYLGPFQGIHPGSTLTRWIVTPTLPDNYVTSINQINTYRVVQTTNYLISPRFEYKRGAFQANLRAGHSYSRVRYRDAEDGRFRSSPNRIGGIGWIAERSSESSPTWTLKQTHGTDWSQPRNWARATTYGLGIAYDSPHFSKNIQNSAYLDLTYAMRVLGHPLTLRGGGGILESDYTYRRYQKTFNYVGPNDRLLGSVIPEAGNYIFDLNLGGKAGNINEQGWRVDDQAALWALYQENPNWFTTDEELAFRRGFLNARDLTEQISAGYIEATTRAGKFSFNAGLRLERTATESMTVKMRPWEEIIEAKRLASPELLATGIFDYTLNDDNTPNEMLTREGFLYRYSDGRRFPRKNSYNNFFLSGGLKYDITKSLRFHLSASQSILRPDYENLAGQMRYSPYYASSIWVPNPALKPEKTTKAYAGLQYYLTAASHISLSAFRLDIDGLQIPNMVINTGQAEAQLGYPLRSGLAGGVIGDDEFEADEIDINYDEIVYRSTVNAEGTRTVYGATLEYNQQLTFLPGYLKGLSLFGSFTLASLKNAQLEEEKIGRANTSANGGIRYRYGRFNAQLRASWQDDTLRSVNRPLPNQRWFTNDHIYLAARTIVDLSGGFRLTRNMELSLSVRNITNSPAKFYSNVPGRLYQYQVYGSTWNLSLKGTF